MKTVAWESTERTLHNRPQVDSCMSHSENLILQGHTNSAQCSPTGEAIRWDNSILKNLPTIQWRPQNIPDQEVFQHAQDPWRTTAMRTDFWHSVWDRSTIKGNSSSGERTSPLPWEFTCARNYSGAGLHLCRTKATRSPKDARGIHTPLVYLCLKRNRYLKRSDAPTNNIQIFFSPGDILPTTTCCFTSTLMGRKHWRKQAFTYTNHQHLCGEKQDAIVGRVLW